MKNDLVTFDWQVHEGGYRWVEEPKEPLGYSSTTTTALTIGSLSWRVGPPYLTTGLTHLQALSRTRDYRPLDTESGLFRTFAEVEPTRSGILEFANEFGTLGGDLEVTIQTSSDSGLGEMDVVGEPLDAWRSEILAMRRAVSLWESVTSGDVAKLSECVRWSGTDSIETLNDLNDPPSWRTLVSGLLFPALMGDVKAGELVRPGWHYLQQILRFRLGGRALVEMVRRPGWTGLDLRIVPRGLIGALWLQLGQAIAGNKEYRRCVCGTWFEISPSVYRRHRQYCSNACRFKSYRDRIERARVLASQGMSIQRIAKELGSDAKTVRAWVTGQGTSDNAGQQSRDARRRSGRTSLKKPGVALSDRVRHRNR